jgi:hypothetical protein
VIGPGAGVRGPNPTLFKLRCDSFVTRVICFTCSFRDGRMVSDDRSPMCSGWDWGQDARMVTLQETGEKNYVDLEKTKIRVFYGLIPGMVSSSACGMSEFCRS